MTNPRIRVRDLTKEYRIYERPSDRLLELFGRRRAFVNSRLCGFETGSLMADLELLVAHLAFPWVHKVSRG